MYLVLCICSQTTFCIFPLLKLRVPNKIDKKETSTSKHIIINYMNIKKTKQKFHMLSTREKEQTTYKGTIMKLTSRISTGTLEGKIQ